MNAKIKNYTIATHRGRGAHLQGEIFTKLTIYKLIQIYLHIQGHFQEI